MLFFLKTACASEITMALFSNCGYSPSTQTPGMPPEVLGAAAPHPGGAKVQRAGDLCELLLALGPGSPFP